LQDLVTDEDRVKFKLVAHGRERRECGVIDPCPKSRHLHKMQFVFEVKLGAHRLHRRSQRVSVADEEEANDEVAITAPDIAAFVLIDETEGSNGALHDRIVHDAAAFHNERTIPFSRMEHALSRAGWNIPSQNSAHHTPKGALEA
jgi:hypothetical protein